MLFRSQGVHHRGSSIQQGGEHVSFDHERVKFSTASLVGYMFFAEAEDGPEELYTVPLFYTLIPDDNPHVLESTPRAANGLFSE